MPDALAQGATHLVSIGGVQSNHTRQVAAVAAKLGLQARLVQESWVDWPDAVNDRVGNILLSRIMGAHVELVEAGFGIGFKQSWENALAEIRDGRRRSVPDSGRRVRPPAGRPGLRELGLRGGAAGGRAGRLLRHHRGLQRDRLHPCRHDRRVRRLASRPAGRHRRVLGIDASAKIAETRAQVERIARNTAELIGLGRELRADEITVLEGWAGDYYGIPVDSTLEAIRLTGRLEGMIIDPVYEGKSMAGLIDLVSTGQIARDSTVLYAHLGGQPAHQRLQRAVQILSSFR